VEAAALVVAAHKVIRQKQLAPVVQEIRRAYLLHKAQTVAMAHMKMRGQILTTTAVGAAALLLLEQLQPEQPTQEMAALAPHPLSLAQA